MATKREAKKRVNYYNKVADQSGMDMQKRVSFISQCIAKKIKVGAFERERDIKKSTKEKKKENQT